MMCVCAIKDFGDGSSPRQDGLTRWCMQIITWSSKSLWPKLTFPFKRLVIELEHQLNTHSPCDIMDLLNEKVGPVNFNCRTKRNQDCQCYVTEPTTCSRGCNVRSRLLKNPHTSCLMESIPSRLVLLQINPIPITSFVPFFGITILFMVSL